MTLFWHVFYIILKHSCSSHLTWNCPEQVLIRKKLVTLMFFLWLHNYWENWQHFNPYKECLLLKQSEGWFLPSLMWLNRLKNGFTFLRNLSLSYFKSLFLSLFSFIPALPGLIWLWGWRATWWFVLGQHHAFHISSVSFCVVSCQSRNPAVSVFLGIWWNTAAGFGSLELLFSFYHKLSLWFQSWLVEKSHAELQVYKVLRNCSLFLWQAFL